jgi:hypothetical protein
MRIGTFTVPRPAEPPSLSYMCERRLADGFAMAPPRAAPQDEAIAQALGRGHPTLSESESKQLLVVDLPLSSHPFARAKIPLGPQRFAQHISRRVKPIHPKTAGRETLPVC